MRVEVPEFTRCCFCIPLRKGLLVWGYLKLVIALVYLICLCLAGVSFMYYRPDFLILLAVALVLCIIDLAFSVVFVVGAHKKNHKLLKAYYYFTLTVMIIYMLLFTLYMGLQIYLFNHREEWRFISRRSVAVNLVQETAVFILNIIIQSYLLLLTRSEVIKIKSGCKFQFVNNAAEAECQLKVQPEVYKA